MTAPATYLLLVHVKHAQQQALAAITYPAGVPTCKARAQADFKTLGYVIGRVREESEAQALKTYTGRAWNCIELEPPCQPSA